MNEEYNKDSCEIESGDCIEDGILQFELENNAFK